jgi:hypothetical protein
MGISKPGDSFQHVPPYNAVNYFWDFWRNYYQLGKGWHRYVYAEHVKFIAEYSPKCNYFFGRSIYRSTQYYTDETELNKPWWLGFIAQFNADKTAINIIQQMPNITDDQFKAYYHECGGLSNF